jgi:hypothetical protein
MRHGLRALGFSVKNFNDKQLVIGVLLRGFIIEGITAYLISKHNFLNELKEKILNDKYYIQAHVLSFDDEELKEKDLDQLISQLQKQTFKISNLKNGKAQAVLEILSLQSCIYARLILKSLNHTLIKQFSNIE